MEIDRTSFQPMLLTILETISRSDFVAFDLELSGIARQPFKTAVTGSDRRGRQSLQERYAETKAAAEKYQVLQVGLTCVEWDASKATYVARPFNFNVSPLIKERIDIERDITFQSGAVEFLLGHRFRLEAPFTEGVPYLSRQEEAAARRIALERQEKWSIADIDLREDDVQGKEFVETTRQAIKTWTSRSTLEPDYLNVPPAQFVGEMQDSRGLNNFQKRLVHQLVRAEFPDLVSASRPGFVQITKFNQDRENSMKKSKQKRLDEQLSRQIGLRWLWEAMVGGDLSGIDERSFTKSQTGEPLFVNLAEITSRIAALQSKFASRPTVLVGHNMFTDLVCLYHTFFGPLPEKVEEFQLLSHRLFPLIIDTKWMFTFHSDDDTLRSSLQEIEEGLRKQDIPMIETHFEHQRYLITEMTHEAGYDSFLTAKILVKLALKLTEQGTVAMPPTTDDSLEPVVPKEGGVRINPSNLKAANRATHPSETIHDRLPSRPLSQGVSLEHSDMPAVAKFKSRPKEASHAAGTVKEPRTIEFSSAGRFDSLLDLPAERGSSPGLEGHTETSTDEDSSSPIPAFDDIFWEFFGNKLRVFGTQETVCELT
ncbi:MAG: Mitochondrial beta-keto-acyl synthase [Chaenotheca gracillima]|nr:MAG: Mitochondrial beta-keto-acyl synthase [Chaenotheca gracillima]